MKQPFIRGKHVCKQPCWEAIPAVVSLTIKNLVFKTDFNWPWYLADVFSLVHKSVVPNYTKTSIHAINTCVDIWLFDSLFHKCYSYSIHIRKILYSHTSSFFGLQFSFVLLWNISFIMMILFNQECTFFAIQQRQVRRFHRIFYECKIL